MTKCMDLKKFVFSKNDPSRKRFNFLSFYQQQRQKKEKLLFYPYNLFGL